jgi:hypothetical protein
MPKVSRGWAFDLLSLAKVKENARAIAKTLKGKDEGKKR